MLTLPKPGALVHRGHRAVGALVRDVSSLRGDGVTLLVSLISVGLTTMAFHGLVGRRLGPADYSAVGSLLSIVLALSLPATVLQLVVTRAVSVCRRRGVEFSARRLLGRVAVRATLAVVVLSLTAPWLRSFLHLGSTSAALWAVAFVLPSFIGIVARGMLIGEQRFAVLAIGVVMAAVLRFGLAVALVTRANGVAMAMAVTTLSEVVLTVFLVVACRRRLATSGVRLRVPWNEGLATVWSFSGLWVLSGAGFVLTRHLLDGDAAGAYAAAATAAQVLLFLPQAIGVIAHSRYSGAGDGEASAVLRSALNATVAACTLFGTVLVVGRVAVIDAWFGRDYAVGMKLMVAMVIAVSGLAVANLLVAFHLERLRRSTPAGWLGVAALAVAATFWNEGAISLAAGFAFAVVAVVFWLWWKRPALRRHGPARALPHPGDALWTSAAVDLSVVVPFHNPGASVVAAVRSLASVLESTGVSFEIIAVDDGSRDGSGERLTTEAGCNELRLVTHAVNHGKGAALRTGFSHSRGRLVGFCDGDGDIDPASWRAFLDLIAVYDVDAVVGSKRHPATQLQVSQIRSLTSRGHQLLVRALFHLPVRDTQVGMKVFRREVLADLLPRTTESGFAFDLELLALARAHGHLRVIEAPVHLYRSGGSTVSWRTVVKVFASTIFVRQRVGRIEAHAQAGPMVSDGRQMAATGSGWK